MPGLRGLLFLALLTLAFNPSDSAAQAVDPSEDPVWTYDPSTGWCVARDESRTCLPMPFEVAEFQSDHGKWVLDDGEAAVIHLWYDCPLPSYTINDQFDRETGTSGHDLKVVEASRVRSVIIYEYASTTIQPKVPPIVVFRLHFTGFQDFQLTLFSQPSETDTMRGMAVTIAQAWHRRSGS